MLSLNTLLKPTDEMMDILHRRKKNMNAKTKEWVNKHTATEKLRQQEATEKRKPFNVVINEKHHTINNIDEAKAFIVDLLEVLKYESLIRNYKLE